MKKTVFNYLSKFIIAVAATLFLASCQDISKGIVRGDSYEDKIAVSISAQYENEKGEGVDFTNNSRTILPDVFDASNLDFKLCGFSHKGNFIETDKETEINLTFATGLIAGQADKLACEIELAYDIWELTLTAYQKTGEKKAVLTGSTVIDLTSGGSEIPFVLSSRGVKNKDGTKTNGGYDLYFKVIDSQSKLKAVTAGVYNKETGAEVITKDCTSFTSEGDYKTFNIKQDNIEPGTYMYKIYFYSDAAKTKSLGMWQDVIVIDSGNTTTASHTTNETELINEKLHIVLPDVIQKIPLSPTNLNAFLVDNSKADDFYTVHLTWDDNSTNEEYFVLTVTEYTDPATAGAVYFTNEDLETASFASSKIREEGSLLCGNTSCKIKLPTGRLFDITLQAKNSIGVSEIVPAKSEGVRVANGTAATGETLYKVDNNKRINLAVLKHYRNGGKLVLSGVEKAEASYVIREIYEGTAIPTLVIDGTTNTLVKNGTQTFQKWVDTASQSGTVNEITGTDWHNVLCYAYFNLTYHITFEQEGYKDLDSDRVTATIVDAGGANTSVMNGNVDGSTATVVTVTIGAPVTGHEDQRTYDEYEFFIDGQSISGGVTNSFTFNTADYEAKTLVINACAKSDFQWYSYTFSVTIQR